MKGVLHHPCIQAFKRRFDKTAALLDMVWQWGCHGPRFSQSHPERLNNAHRNTKFWHQKKASNYAACVLQKTLLKSIDVHQEQGRKIQERMLEKSACIACMACIALQRLRSGILRRDFGHSLCCSDLQSTTDRLGCCSPGGIKYAKLIKHKAFGMPRLPSGVFCSFRSGRSL